MSPLPALPDGSFQRVLCVAAHPDDIEYGMSAAVAIWTSRGVEVSYLMLTRGEAGMDSTPPERTAVLRTADEIAGAAQVGVDRVDFLDHPDGVLEYSVSLRRDITRTIRALRPDMVCVGTWEIEYVAGLNQSDHRAAGLAAIDAVRDAGNRWVFAELAAEGLEPWSVRWLLVGAHTQPTHGVDVTGEPLERGIASLEAHNGYLAGIPGHPTPREMIPMITGMQGRAMGVPNAVLFRAWDLAAPPSIAGGESGG